MYVPVLTVVLQHITFPLMMTYSSNFFKIRPVASEVDELLVEEPGKLEVQREVMRHLAGQHNALPHGHVQMTCWTGDPCWL